MHATSDLALHCLHMSHKKEAMLICVNISDFLTYILNGYVRYQNGLNIFVFSYYPLGTLTFTTGSSQTVTSPTVTMAPTATSTQGSLNPGQYVHVSFCMLCNFASLSLYELNAQCEIL